MINLIPPSARKIAIQEYWFHVVSAWAVLLSVVLGVIALLLLPSYVLTYSQVRALEVTALDQRDTEDEYQLAEDVVKEANRTAIQLAEPGVALATHEVIEAVHAASGEGITMRLYRIERNEMALTQIQIQGVATSREALASFKERLEHHALFESAQVPIADLARDRDLPFAITVTITPIRNSS